MNIKQPKTGRNILTINDDGTVTVHDYDLVDTALPEMMPVVHLALRQARGNPMQKTVIVEKEIPSRIYRPLKNSLKVANKRIEELENLRMAVVSHLLKYGNIDREEWETYANKSEG